MVARSVGPVPTVLVGPYPRPRVYAAVLSPFVPPTNPSTPSARLFPRGTSRSLSSLPPPLPPTLGSWGLVTLPVGLRRSIFSFARPSDHGHTAVVAAAAAAAAVAADATQYRLAMGYRRRAEKRERAKRRWNQCV